MPATRVLAFTVLVAVAVAACGSEGAGPSVNTSREIEEAPISSEELPTESGLIAAEYVTVIEGERTETQDAEISAAVQAIEATGSQAVVREYEACRGAPRFLDPSRPDGDLIAGDELFVCDEQDPHVGVYAIEVDGQSEPVDLTAYLLDPDDPNAGEYYFVVPDGALPVEAVIPVRAERTAEQSEAILAAETAAASPEMMVVTFDFDACEPVVAWVEVDETSYLFVEKQGLVDCASETPYVAVFAVPEGLVAA